VATREKNIWILLIFLLSGLVIGGLLGEFATKDDFLWWLSYGLMFKINIASIIGMAIAIFIYRKV